jgi:autoinducer 2-binding protein LuxP
MNTTNGYTLKDSYYVNFNRELAAEATLQLLDDHQTSTGKPTLDFIYAASTDIALGALDSLKQRGLEKVIQVNGWGGGSAELDSIRKKELDFTVMRMNDDNGVAMAEAIALDISGLSNQVPTIYSGSFRQVTQNTKEKQIQRFEQRAFRYSNNDPQTP